VKIVPARQADNALADFVRFQTHGAGDTQTFITARDDASREGPYCRLRRRAFPSRFVFKRPQRLYEIHRVRKRKLQDARRAFFIRKHGQFGPRHCERGTRSVTTTIDDDVSAATERR